MIQQPTVEAPSELLIKKLHKISEQFDIAVGITEELSTAVEEEFSEAIEENTMMANLHDDFVFSRDTLKSTITSAKKVLVTVSNKLNCVEDLDTRLDAELVASYASLVGIVNSSLKLLTDIYKNMTDVQIKIYKHTKDIDPVKPDIKNGGQISVDVKSILEHMKKE